MKLTKLTKIIAGAALLLGAFTQAQAADATDPSGTYIWTQPGRNGGPDRTNTMVLKLDGDKLTGSITAPGRGGAAGRPRDISSGKVTGAAISFELVRTTQNGDSMTNKYSGTLASGTITGKIEGVNQNGDPTSRDWTATMQK